MLDPNLRDYLAKGYVKIGDIGYAIAINMRKGKNGTVTQRNLYEQGIKMYLILDVLFRQVTFDEITLVPTLWRITEEQVNHLLTCLVKIGDLNASPIAPSLFPTVKPVYISSGLPGPPGTPGVNGIDANINVVLANGEKQLQISQSVISGVKTYALSFVNYIKQLLSVNSIGLFEIGTSQDFNINLSSTKGNQSILTITCTDTTTNTVLQGLLDLVQANGVTQPYVIVIAITGQLINKTYTFNSNDGVNTVTTSTSISFVYPFFYGHDPSNSINPYTTLTKLIAVAGNKQVNYNLTDEYAYFAYPASYGDLTSIKDQNGFDITGAWTKTVVSVTSTGLVNNWTVSYNVYRTTLRTTIVNSLYSFNF